MLKKRKISDKRNNFIPKGTRKKKKKKNRTKSAKVNGWKKITKIRVEINETMIWKTIEQINKEGLKISEIYFRQVEKSNLAKKINLDLMIDDNKIVYNNMKNENIDCILFGDKIKNWKEVLEYIKRKER